jgi:hypothetical protein
MFFHFKTTIHNELAMAEQKLDAAIYWLSWINLAKTVGFVLVAIGLTSTLVAEMVGRPFQRVVDSAREDEQKRHASELARLEVEAQLARAAFASSTARAKEAELALERIKAPRVIDEEQRHQIVRRLKTFAGIHFDLAIRPEPEPQAFAEQIAAVLQAAGWIRVAKQNAGSLAITIPGKPNAAVAAAFVGLGAEIDGSRAAEWGSPMSALVNALTDQGFAFRSNVATDGTAPPDAIHLFIGSKQ